MGIQKDACVRCGGAILPGRGRKVGNDKRICKKCDHDVSMIQKRSNEYLQTVASILYTAS